MGCHCGQFTWFSQHLEMVFLTFSTKSFHYSANFKITSFWFEVFQKLCEEKLSCFFFAGTLAQVCTSVLNKLHFRKHLCSLCTVGMF